MLGEVKTIQNCPLRYKVSHGNARGAARARGIPKEYEFKAMTADMLHFGCGRKNTTACRSAGCNCCELVGRIRTELRRHKVEGYVMGAYGEGSVTVHTLIRYMAEVGAKSWGRLLPTASHTGAKGRLGWLIKRRIGSTAVRAGARLLLDRMEFVGAGAGARGDRRKATRKRHQRHWHEEARHQHGVASQADHAGSGARDGSFWD